MPVSPYRDGACALVWCAINSKDPRKFTHTHTHTHLWTGVLGIQLAHDMAHFATAKAKGLKLGVPIYIPSLQVCTLCT